ncbi:DNA-processing protein DprA [bacterium]|nr:DNA-processing protein DprA [bacterium]
MSKYFHAWNCVFEGLPKPFWNLYRNFSDLKYAWEKADIRELELKGLRGPYKTAFEKLRKSGEPFKHFDDFQKNNIQAIDFKDKQYPKNLRNLNNHLPPAILYIKGNLPQGYTYLSIVGTRTMTPYGEQVTTHLLSKLADYKICIVSGLARGIDTIAHINALKNNLPTISVLGYGIYNVPFYVNNLSDQITENGALISEYPPHLQAQKYYFPLRNRIISGISKATLVVEAGKKSGALITAQYALDQGRDVMAIPGNIYQEKSLGTNRIINQSSANLVANIKDILSILGINKLHEPTTKIKSIKQKNIMEALSKRSLSKSQLIEKTNMSAQDINIALTELEIEQYIDKNRAGNYYISC